MRSDASKILSCLVGEYLILFASHCGLSVALHIPLAAFGKAPLKRNIISEHLNMLLQLMITRTEEQMYQQGQVSHEGDAIYLHVADQNTKEGKSKVHMVHSLTLVLIVFHLEKCVKQKIHSNLLVYHLRHSMGRREVFPSGSQILNLN